MGSFVKFIFTLIVAGALVNLAIVLMANAQSQRRQSADATVERDLFSEQIKRLNEPGRLERADILVEWQKNDARNAVQQTSLLVRQYALSRTGDAVAMPLVRVMIPGNRVSIDGLMLHFDSLFHEQGYEVLQDKSLVYFAGIYGENEPVAERFSLLRPPEVPELTRLHPEQRVPSLYEMRLWQFIWNLVPPRALPGAGAGEGGGTAPVSPTLGVKVTWLPAYTKTVTVGETWSAFVGSDGNVTIEPAADAQHLKESILDEAEAPAVAPAGAGAARGQDANGGM